METATVRNNTLYVTLKGAVVKKPELRKSSSGKEFTIVRIANKRSWKDRETGEWKHSEPNYINVTIFGKSAKPAATLEVGNQIEVTGNLVWAETEKADANGEMQLYKGFQFTSNGYKPLYKDNKKADEHEDASSDIKSDKADEDVGPESYEDDDCPF